MGKNWWRDNPHLWEPLVGHLADASEIARLLWREWIGEAAKRTLQDQIGMDDEECETLVAWLAGIHDVGKATPSFESKVPARAEAVSIMGLCFGNRCEPHSHAFMGEVIVCDWLMRRGWDERRAKGIASIVGGHHGANPNEDDLKQICTRTHINPNASMGDEHWSRVQDELLGYVLESAGAQVHEQSLRSATIPTRMQILLTGIVIMADWIASNTTLVPLEARFVSWRHSAIRANGAWQALRLPRGMIFGRKHCEPDLLFHKRFPHLPLRAKMTSLQRDAVEVALAMNQPGLLIIEESMGAGKTEAALLCCEILASKFGCNGAAFLLPTQATSNAMFKRIEGWLDVVLKDQNGAKHQDLHLLHSKASLNEDYASLPQWGTSWVGDDDHSDESIGVHQWFSGRKRGLLAPCVVGTVDQLLMIALRSKHVQLRHLGLAGKVVIIDEVHAYDAYMSVYLARAIEYLGSYNVPVIMLSATLPPSRREALLKAYRSQERGRFGKSISLTPPPRLQSGNPCYPLISSTGRDKHVDPQYRMPHASRKARKVRVEMLPDDDEALLAELRQSLKDGGCVCVLRNTVARAQHTYRLLCRELSVRVVLTHSRFIAIDRAHRDLWLGQVLGPGQDGRPEALVVVGTQVLEQSLDIDFDLLITDVAPIDLLLQRMGRLHRHMRGEGETLRPPALRVPRCIITGVVDWDAAVPEFGRGITRVYQTAVLMRTLCAIKGTMGNSGLWITLPDDIAPLVESVYEHKVDVPLEWESAYERAVGDEETASNNKKAAACEWLLPKPNRVSLDGWMRNQVRIDDDIRGRAAVRDAEESVEVIVVQRSDGELRVLPWVSKSLGMDGVLGNGIEAPPDEKLRVAALCSVSLPPTMSAARITDAVIDAIRRDCPCLGWRESRWFDEPIVLAVDPQGEAVISCPNNTFHLRYTQECGLELYEKGGSNAQ